MNEVKKLKNSLEKHVGKTNTDKLIKQVKKTIDKVIKNAISNKKAFILNHKQLESIFIENLISKFPNARKDKIGFESSNVNDCMIPKNLYTFLLTNNIEVDYDKVKDKNEFENHDGTKYKLIKGSEEKVIIIPSKPAKFITVDFTLKKDTNNATKIQN